jgi:hypothetical protein
VKARLIACAVAGLACAFPIGAGAQVSGPRAPRPYDTGPNAQAFARIATLDQVMAGVRAAGLQPLTRPALRGGFYYLRALNRRNAEVRVTIDARSGRVVAANQLAFDQPRPGAGAPPPLPPRYEPYVRGGGYSEEALVPPGDVPVEGRPIPERAPGYGAQERAPGYGASPPPRKLAAPIPRARPGDSEVTGALPETPAAKPAEPAQSAAAAQTTANPVPAKPQMVPIAPLE